MAHLLTTTSEEIHHLTATFQKLLHDKITFEIDESLVQICLESIHFPCTAMGVKMLPSDDECCMELIVASTTDGETNIQKMWRFQVRDGILHITFGNISPEESESKTRTISYVMRHFTVENFRSVWRKRELSS
ncbi:hypothetical protein [Shimazuella kribbensis]|uniref:hypothetical protein n=1 Tax=Shimazuella kribbensis TaxID=139808 RepID=UPI000491AC89|nr:hypothetical protein [Shimazuella kribbensis]